MSEYNWDVTAAVLDTEPHEQAQSGLPYFIARDGKFSGTATVDDVITVKPPRRRVGG